VEDVEELILGVEPSLVDAGEEFGDDDRFR